MKTVYSDISQIAHLWANLVQKEAKTSSRNFFFNGDTIYSYGYSFPIAKHKTVNGIDAVLFTERSYSVTTSKHTRVTWQACNHKNIVYCYSPDSSHAENFNFWQRNAESVAKNLLKAKKPEKYLSELSIINGKVDKYAAFFSLPVPESLQAVLNIKDKTEFAAYAEKKSEYERKEKERQEKELLEQHAADLAKWLNGELPRLYVRDGFDYLRITDNRIETTQGVKIPIEAARRFYDALTAGTVAAGSKILDFEVREVSPEIVKIGCHTFNRAYLDQKAVQFFA
jgi:hypothetical protein